ncbi:protease PrsW [Nocardia panacis]|uniref:Protease PrsW n=1 Tax=Nocardia panacis TaxID=2340916 RepID=A0A3A4K743_9NOCA|nr:PrsW family intramembrane metalloprotease [Nocardia panacis]RJO76939.1 protease PrsW [Nocardia panacis]
MRWWQAGSALFWVYVLSLLIGWAALILQLLGVLAATGVQVAVGTPFAVVTLLVFGWLIVLLDRLRARTVIRGGMIMGLLWGALAGPGLALFANDRMMRIIQGLAGESFADSWQAPISATIVEEGVKGLGVFTVAWLGRGVFVRPMQGLLLGACTGLGFQVVEDVIYSANAGVASAEGGAAPAILVGVVRFVAGLASHWMFTAFAGIGIVLAVARRDWAMPRRIGVLAAWYLLGCALHFGWDAPGPDGLENLLIVVKLLGYIVVFAAVYVWVLHTERVWLRALTPFAAARGLAPAPELATLVTRRSRRRARKLIPVPKWQQTRRQRWLLDELQRLGTLPLDRLIPTGPILEAPR